MEGEGRVWPFLPANDPYALQRAVDRDADTDNVLSEAEADLTCFIHKIGYMPELVVLTMTSPAELPSVLAQANGLRDHTYQQAFPMLLPVDPQPAQGSVVLMAFPAWLSHDTCVCFDLSDFDGRQFAVSVPAHATRTVLLQLCELDPEAADIYLGSAHEPMGLEELPLYHGMYVFVVQRHVLPGPYFHVQDTLLDARLWDEFPPIPIPPAGGYFCAVGEAGHRRIPVERNSPLVDRDELAAHFGIQAADLLTQPALPTVADVALAGFGCRNACAVVSAAAHSEAGPADPLTIALIDCRAIMQGWALLATVTGTVSRQEIQSVLTTFMPDGWSLSLAGLPEGSDECPINPGQVISASFVPPFDHGSEEDFAPEDGDSEAPTDEAAMSDPGSADQPMTPPGSNGAGGTSDSSFRSRSPHRSPVDGAGLVNLLCTRGRLWFMGLKATVGFAPLHVLSKIWASQFTPGRALPMVCTLAKDVSACGHSWLCCLSSGVPNVCAGDADEIQGHPLPSAGRSGPPAPTPASVAQRDDLQGDAPHAAPPVEVMQTDVAVENDFMDVPFFIMG